MDDHLATYEDWLRYQMLDGQHTPEQEAALRAIYEREKKTAEAHDPAAMFRRPSRLGQYRYAVAIEEGGKLWLTLLVTRSPNGECFILIPRDSDWNPHASYHLDGRLHYKSYGTRRDVRQLQPLIEFKAPNIWEGLLATDLAWRSASQPITRLYYGYLLQYSTTGAAVCLLILSNQGTCLRHIIEKG